MAGLTTAGAQAILPEGFYETQVRGLTSPTAMAVGPDGWMLVCEQRGSLRLIRNGALQTQPFLQVDVQAFQERGLDGVQFDPGFATNRWIYIYYTAAQPTLHNRLSRFTAGETNAVAGSEVVLLDLPTLGVSGWHNGGSIAFGPDDKLYLGVGDNNIGAFSQAMDTPLGKVLRLNRDGSIPADNPFATTAVGVNRAIWALGFRNPFTMAFQPGTGRLFVNDVGRDTWEEINDVVRGGNYGWPVYEGPANDPNFKTPLFAYRHPVDVNASSAITGGTFYNPATNQFPAEFVGKYFFADGFTQVIGVLDPSTGVATNFATFAPFPASGPDVTPLYLTVGPDGSLYYIARVGRAINRIRHGVSPVPRVGGQPADLVVVVGEAARFKITAYGREPLTFRWERKAAGQGSFTAIPGATQPEYALGAASVADDNTQFRCVVTNPFGTATSRAATLRALSDTPPVPVIDGPVEGATYRAGDTIAFSGFGTDREDGRLAPARLSWRIDFQHHDHSHPFVPDTRGIEGGSFTIPTSGETSDDVWYRIALTATDSQGISRTVVRDVLPVKSAITLDTVPPGLQVLLDGGAVTAPYVFVGVTGVERVIEARSQTANGVAYEFQSWSDGGAARRTMATPGSDTTLVARFRALTAVSDAAEFVSQTVTNDMVGGATYPVTVVMRNTGDTTWTTAANYYLASQNPPDTTTWGIYRVRLAGPVAPGALATFSFTVTAPGELGTNDMQWQVVRDGFYYFGALTPNVVVRVGTLANDARFVAQAVPATMVVDQFYEVTVTLRNNGANAWTAASFYRLSSQNPAENDSWGTSRVELANTVAAGESATFSFTVTAPSAPGRYDFQWRMIQDGVGWFGEFTSNVVVQVTALPEIRSQPADVTVTAGQPAAFGVTAIGPEPLSYQWRRGDREILGATAAGYRIAATTTGDDGAKFSCVVSSLAGSVTTRVTVLRVTPPPLPEIRGQPADVMVRSGQPAAFGVTAIGPEPLSYQWKRDDRAISGATTAGFRIAVTTTGDDGAKFSCVVSNLAGSVMSRVALLRVTNPPVPVVTRVSPARYAVEVSASATISATFSVGMQADTLTPGRFYLQKVGAPAPVPAVVSYDSGTRTATLRPSGGLDPAGAGYNVVIRGGANGVKSLEDAALAGEVTWSFRTADTVPPAVVSYFPSGGGAVSGHTAINLTLSEALNEATLTAGTLTLRESGQTQLIPAYLAYYGGTRSLTLVPTKKLRKHKTYVVTLLGGPGGIADRAGNRLRGNFVFTFTVGGDHERE